MGFSGGAGGGYDPDLTLTTEIERLTRERDSTRALYVDSMAERDRLRAALEQIGGNMCARYFGDHGPEVACGHCMPCIAREALRGGK